MVPDLMIIRRMRSRASACVGCQRIERVFSIEAGSKVNVNEAAVFGPGKQKQQHEQRRNQQPEEGGSRKRAPKGPARRSF